jgi:outer membrane protein OmpA-like peptidoglycan-associated protein
MTVEPAQLHSFGSGAEQLPYDRYEAVLELYQAENAVQIAQSLGADQLAPESFSKATALLSQAQDMNARKMDTHAIVSTAREATQMAEDARTITVKRRDEERHLRELPQSQEQGELRRQAVEEAEAAQAQAQAATERADRERDRAEQAQAEAAQAQAIAAQQAAQQRAAVLPPPNPPSDRSSLQQQHRAELFAQLNSTLATRDTPRGLVVTINDSMFEPGGGRLRTVASQPLANLAAILSSHPGLRVRVEGYADSEPLSDERAQSVRTALIVSGTAPNLISAVGYGNSRPIAPSVSGQEQNRRVEVVIDGDGIGNKALWDHPYPLRSGR